MNIIDKMETARNKFDELRAQAVALNTEIGTIQENANAQIKERQENIQLLTEEMTRTQGAHRALVEIGIEQGILNEEGVPIQDEAAKPE